MMNKKNVFLLGFCTLIILLSFNVVEAKDNTAIGALEIEHIILDNRDETDNYEVYVKKIISEHGIEGLRGKFDQFGSVEIEIQEDVEDKNIELYNNYQGRIAKNSTYYKEVSYGPDRGEYEWITEVRGEYTVDTKNQRIVSASSPSFSLDVFGGGYSNFYKSNINKSYSIRSDKMVVDFNVSYDLTIENNFGLFNYEYNFSRKTDRAQGSVLAPY